MEIDLGKPFARLTMNDAIKKYTGIDFDQVPDDAAAKKLADEHHIAYEERHKKGDIINLFFEEYCEKELIQPTFIMDHPIEISPLTKKKPSDPTKVERFELFCNTWEMCNAYSELMIRLISVSVSLHRMPMPQPVMTRQSTPMKIS